MNEGTHPDHSGTRADELLLARVSEAAGRGTRAGARLDLYEHGLTAATDQLGAARDEPLRRARWSVLRGNDTGRGRARAGAA
ncbi:hypothetical protein [Streptomyces curacoi]|uniref:Uncharacterized protein n=1 Tax=Streptomyces curacoi TaxID=146536 RepID=A0A117NWZ0_9ACTN|nr:hypothetical protein [Streptomyces curacoi]KUM68909.1 hypothetical protein AQI70_33460 [Streptomyces curacoi]